jgi:anaerobic selenocysteine-containing dehydrogenase
MPETQKSFCRFCHVFCGVEVDVEDGRVVEVRGDPENAVTRGYTCPKGRAEPERIHHPERLLAPRRRAGDRWEATTPARALDEVALRLREIVAKHGPDAVAVYTGCGGHRTAAGGPWFVRRWLDALGSKRMYTSFTIDSPSLAVAGQRFYGGPLPAGLLDVDRAEVVLFVGTNPIASHQLNMPQSNPGTRLKDAQRRGMKLIVVDPRRSDAARRADLHLAVKPGEDATLLAAMLKVILDERLHDAEYVARFVSGVEALHAAVADFDLDYAARRTGVAAEQIAEAARWFAGAATGGAQSGTGLHMAPHHNLTTQLVMTLNAVCGRIDRPGGLNRCEGPLGRRIDASMTASPRSEEAPKSRIRNIPAVAGLFGQYWEMPTNTLADEILTPGEGQIRALIVNGGNPALVLAEEASALAALESLELLVVLDLFPSATAELADYVFAVKHPFERADVTKLMDGAYPFPFGQYTPPLVPAPEHALEEWQVFWELAARLGLPLRVGALTPERTPSTDELLDAQFARARVPLAELRRHPSGAIFGEPATAAGGVVPNLIAHADHKMAAGHPELLAELREVRAEPLPDGGGYEPAERFRFRLITYRMKEVYCTQGQNLPSLRRKRPYNPLLIHPDAMRELGIAEGERVAVTSGFGRVEAIAEASETLRRDVVALAFGWGNPLDPRDLREKGANVQRLIPDDRLHDPVSGLARQSALPVNVAPL